VGDGVVRDARHGLHVAGGLYPHHVPGGLHPSGRRVLPGRDGHLVQPGARDLLALLEAAGDLLFSGVGEAVV
jgi:hypothetical protein